MILWEYLKTVVFVQSLSHVRLLVTPWMAACQASLSITNSQSLLRLISIESVMPSNHLILCHPLLLLISVFPSIKVFSNESALRSGDQSTGTSTSASVLQVNTQGWFPLGLSFLLSKGLLSLLQHSSKVSVLLCSAFFMVRLSHLYITTGKTIALTTWTFVGKVMSLLLNMLSMFVVPFLPKKSLNLAATVTVRVDFGIQENKIFPLLPLFPLLINGCLLLLCLFLMILVKGQGGGRGTEKRKDCCHFIFLSKSVLCVLVHTGTCPSLAIFWASLVAQTVKCLPTKRETRVRSLGREDSLEKEMATHSSIHAWRIPGTEEPGRLRGNIGW